MDIHALKRWQNPGGQRCLEATGLPWGARSPTFKIQGSTLPFSLLHRFRFQHFSFSVWPLITAFRFPISAFSFQHFSVSAFPPRSCGQWSEVARSEEHTSE